MPQQPKPALLADLRDHHAASTPGPLPDRLTQAGLAPLTGGRNNTVYTWKPAPGHPNEIIKLYKTDERGRSHREWTALTHLHTTHPGDTPAPLWEDLDHPRPAIGMSHLPGTPLPDIDRGQLHTALKSLAALHSRIHDLPLPTDLADTPRTDSWAHYTRRLTDVWPAQLANTANDPDTPALLHLLDAWTSQGDHLGHLTHASTPVFSRGDSNLLNWLWSATEHRIRCVDFEFTGHSTIAFDAADLTEHISARAVPDAFWEELLPDLGITTALRPAYTSAQRTCALRWLAVLWKQRTTRTTEYKTQLTRTQTLFKTTR